MSHNRHVEYTLMEPLLGSDNEDRGSIEFKPVSATTTKDHFPITSAAARRSETWGRARLVIVTLVAFLLIYVSIASSGIELPQVVIVHVPPDENPVPDGYLVWSPKCKIASLDPMARDVMALFHREKPIACTTKPALTEIERDLETDSYFLRVVPGAKKGYHLYGEGQCVYQEITRNGDAKIKFSDGIKFTYKVELPVEAEFIFVECFDKSHKEPIYRDVHFVVQKKKSIAKRLEALQTAKNITNSTSNSGRRGGEKEKSPSLLMIGIDSISRLNLLRAMPKTAQHLYDTGWFEMKGYNKMGDNTYPNLMAILTGYNLTWAYQKCAPTTEHGLDECPFIWKEFAAAGYVTGYAEDEVDMSTFNYRKKGFTKPPTDYYSRPGMLAAASRLPKVTRSSLAICLGDRSSADYIYQYGLDITERYMNEGTFGLYWTNSFSHNDLNTPTSMDHRVKFYLQELDRRQILNNSIVIFFSDHGLRFGPVRKLVTGWMEERLPFLFFWLPKSFRDEHPEIVQALKINRNRLTNPYDVHLTLKHILRMSGRVEHTEDSPADVASGCENCQSIFTEVPWNRSCEDIGIEAHWCTCAPYLPIDKNSKVVKKASKFLIDYLNKEIKTLVNGTTKENGDPLCAQLHLRRVDFAGETEYKASYKDILITFETSPGGGEFESTVRYVPDRDTFSVTGHISRLNAYSKHSKCVGDEHARMYCECL